MPFGDFFAGIAGKSRKKDGLISYAGVRFAFEACIYNSKRNRKKDVWFYEGGKGKTEKLKKQRDMWYTIFCYFNATHSSI